MEQEATQGPAVQEQGLAAVPDRGMMGVTSLLVLQVRETRDGWGYREIMVMAVISVVPYLASMSEHTTLCKINKNVCIKPQK